MIKVRNIHACNPSIGTWRQRNHDGFKVGVSFIVNLRPALLRSQLFSNPSKKMNEVGILAHAHMQLYTEFSSVLTISGLFFKELTIDPRVLNMTIQEKPGDGHYRVVCVNGH